MSLKKSNKKAIKVLERELKRVVRETKKIEKEIERVNKLIKKLKIEKYNTLDFIYCYEYFKVEGKQLLEDIKTSMINAGIYGNYIEYKLSENEKQILIEILNEHCYLDVLRISNFMFFIGNALFDDDECLKTRDLKYYITDWFNDTPKDELYEIISSNDMDDDVDFRLYFYNDMVSYYRDYEYFSNPKNTAILEEYIVEYLKNNDNY